MQQVETPAKVDSMNDPKPALQVKRRRKGVAPSLPISVAVEQPHLAGADTAPTAAMDRRTLRILIVEDHADTARALSRLLTGEGHAVLTAGTVRQALQMIAVDRLDLLICDIALPDGTGHDVLRQMQPPQLLAAIALSAHVSDEDYRLSRDSGFRAHIAKPVDFQQLSGLIQSLA
jgi:two-component system, chemotaxis family, CheB/CheR fusion protein